ncbi:MAG: hypothetical protein COZ80_11960 [Ignavibacteria bacterium CG_4_8_14_3_um_filter_37_9]|nr:hypothetical protein [Ignavibacteria bacterium]OIO14164.1 MAG: hypothetical protein AUJ54_14715 [Ignavibacteria bacterium CG1_02_37_35]PIP77003.1 MAG: hypothetical protein COW85_11205 [Ignavibacteria bacterium CG22_combo_CG10-13_8_21_14_all_37_15]PIS46262.1 MAG: hypothetical protein COT22_00930 [Ignavibacteria bacterium CG08_land_8_20_14_0_20_37_9]PIW98171.1 MAG: hypothetical protein COZ80_11960 [Ignavibacteria bacterium CG_4_8_14_3_um_filter_37_9]
MDLKKQYIIQTISVAANNLRLSSEKIEVLGLLKETILNAGDLETLIASMKKITQFSKLAIKLQEIYNYLKLNKIDFLKLSDKFKEHTQLVVKDLNLALDALTPNSYNAINIKLNEFSLNSSTDGHRDESLTIDFTDRKSLLTDKMRTARIKENYIFEEETNDDQLFFQNFEATILKPVKEIELVLKNLGNGEFKSTELRQYESVMRVNASLSEKFGTEITTEMHNILARAFRMLQLKELNPEKEMIEAMRACLIVIVALVRNKDIDITYYLNRAEDFGKKLQTLKMRNS